MSWITASAGLFLVLTLIVVSLVYRLRARPPGDNNNNNSAKRKKLDEGEKVKETQISVISESYV